MFGISKDTWIIAGLGNPGGKYSGTRHNAGFDAVDAIATKYGIEIKKKLFKAHLGMGKIDGKKVILVKPQTYMNSSGEAIAPICGYYKVNPDEKLIVLYDDISLAPGNLRIKTKGSAGGHNGMKSIISCLDSEGFDRIKIGVGEKPQGWDLADFVLSRFSAEERQKIDEALDNAVEAAELIIAGKTDEAMNRFNRKNS
ncbi:MAG: aminoacyl-tRNA hydrolase [Eubacterium sp.]|nr:aminoacyl-tRNA hydrolase [Eubacterium sp.]